MNHPSIIVMSGEEAGSALALDEVLNTFSIGSDLSCHLVLSGLGVSPTHASVFLDDEGVVTLSDTNSLTGVFINGTRIMEQALTHGDQISLGPPDDPTSDLLRFSANGEDGPLVDLSSAESEGLSGLEGFDPPLEEPLLTSELGRPAFASESAGSFSLDSLDAGLAEIPALEPLPEPAPAEEFPPVDLFAEPEPAPLPEPEPEPAPPPRAPAPKTAPPQAAAPSAAAPSRGRPAPRRSDSSDADPLAGLAESLGGSSGARGVPPPPVADVPVVLPRAAKGRATPAIMAARVAIAAVVLGGLAWFGLRSYSKSIVVPLVDKYLPNPAEPGQTVTINGSGFGDTTDPKSVKVTLGPTELQVLDVNSTRINVMIPETLAAAGSQTLPLKVTAQGTTSSAQLLKVSVAPKITSLTPRVGLAGDEIVIAGKWLSSAKVKPTVMVAGNEAEVLEATPTSIRIRIPAVSATEGQKVSVRAALGPDVGKEAPLHYGRLPFVDTIAPARAQPGDVVTITGLGLTGPDLAVMVGSRSAVLLSGTDTEVRISVPGTKLSESAGQRELVVHTNQRASIAHPLEILRESSALYTPRFFTEMVEGSRVAISCELGPVMILGSDAKAHVRAHEAAAKLNALVATGRSTRVEFNAHDVTISTSGAPVLALVTGDGALSPRVLAPIWAAALTDMFDLFLQGRRPGRTLELSPDGKVFVDIFAAARRRSAEAGVPNGVLFSPDPAWSTSLASLASSPATGAGQALALLDGYWAGVIEVPGAIQPRKVEISLTATPSGLVGQRTSRQGKLSTDVSLQGLSYNRRELRFSLVDSGETLIYVGRLDGDEIDGILTKASGAKVGRVKFKLTR